jgi:hypothetical protein
VHASSLAFLNVACTPKAKIASIAIVDIVIHLELPVPAKELHNFNALNEHKHLHKPIIVFTTVSFDFSVQNHSYLLEALPKAVNTQCLCSEEYPFTVVLDLSNTPFVVDFRTNLMCFGNLALRVFE